MTCPRRSHFRNDDQAKLRICYTLDVKQDAEVDLDKRRSTTACLNQSLGWQQRSRPLTALQDIPFERRSQMGRLHGGKWCAMNWNSTICASPEHRDIGIVASLLHVRLCGYFCRTHVIDVRGGCETSWQKHSSVNSAKPLIGCCRDLRRRSGA